MLDWAGGTRNPRTLARNGGSTSHGVRCAWEGANEIAAWLSKRDDEGRAQRGGLHVDENSRMHNLQKTGETRYVS